MRTDLDCLAGCCLVPLFWFIIFYFLLATAVPVALIILTPNHLHIHVLVQHTCTGNLLLFQPFSTRTYSDSSVSVPTVGFPFFLVSFLRLGCAFRVYFSNFHDIRTTFFSVI